MFNYIDLLKSIGDLPDEIKHIIDTYNHSHRPLMKIVFTEMIYLYFPEQTDEYWRRIYHISIRELPNILYCENCSVYKSISQLNSEYCSQYCEDDACDRYEMLNNNFDMCEDDFY